METCKEYYGINCTPYGINELNSIGSALYSNIYLYISCTLKAKRFRF